MYKVIKIAAVIITAATAVIAQDEAPFPVTNEQALKMLNCLKGCQLGYEMCLRDAAQSGDTSPLASLQAEFRCTVGRNLCERSCTGWKPFEDLFKN